jgi:hypothetical protein
MAVLQLLMEVVEEILTIVAAVAVPMVEIRPCTMV